MKNRTVELHQNGSLPINGIPLLSAGDFKKTALEQISRGARVVSFFSLPQEGEELLFLLLSDDAEGRLGALSMAAEKKAFPSLTGEAPQFHLFEREIYEQTGIRPEGHPWLKPVRTLSASGGGAAGEGDFFRVEGSEIHEVAVGPIHAGVIEPGHFRFQCHGEKVFHLEIGLGYQHRGIEKALVGGPHPDTLFKMGVLAGDTTIGHSTAYSRIVEALSGTEISPRAEAVRAIALELERCANHIGDLGALAGDIGYLPTASYCGRIRGDFLNMSAVICGNRFGRGVVLPGGTGWDLDHRAGEELKSRLEAGRRDFMSAVSLLWDNPTVLARFDSTGTVSRETAERIGMVGPSARACGCHRDVRRDHPWGSYRTLSPEVSISEMGDVFARAYVRWLEVQESIKYIERLLAELPRGEVRRDITTPLCPHSMAVSLVEGWRGEICHVALTDGEGRFSKYKIVDPSFHNWFGLSLALRGEQISDFPVCNKSFNLSYCGFDL